MKAQKSISLATHKDKVEVKHSILQREVQQAVCLFRTSVV